MASKNRKESGSTPQADWSCPPLLRVWNMAEHGVQDQPWLWDERIPVGGLTVVATPSGGDASPLIANMAARVTLGVTFPGDNRPQSLPESRRARRVVVVSAGGNPRCGLALRIVDAGGRSKQLLVINGVTPGTDNDSPCETPEDHSLSLPGDLKLLRQKILELNRGDGASQSRNLHEQNQVGLLVIESLTVHVEKWRENELRSLFDRLNRLAVELNLAVVLLTPLTTVPSRVREGKVTLGKALGSAALAEAAAAIWQVEPLADNPDHYEFVPLKTRKRLLPHAFRVENESVYWELPETTATSTLPAKSPPVRPEPRTVESSSPAPKAVDRQLVADVFQRPSESEKTAVSIPHFPTSPRPEPTEAAECNPAAERNEPTNDRGSPSPVNAPPADRPTPSRGAPRARTAAEIRQSPEWKRASRIERKRLLRAAAVDKPRGVSLRNSATGRSESVPPIR